MAYVVLIGRSIMAQPRTVKTLVALVVSMTLGTFALVAMQTEPIRSPILELAAVSFGGAEDLAGVVEDIPLPVRADQWDNVILHYRTDGPDDVGARFHFIVTSGRDGKVTVRSTDLWRRQQPGNHTVTADGKDWNARSVGVFVEPDCDDKLRQDTLTSELCSVLQEICSIPVSRVYSRRHLP